MALEVCEVRGPGQRDREDGSQTRVRHRDDGDLPARRGSQQRLHVGRLDGRGADLDGLRSARDGQDAAVERSPVAHRRVALSVHPERAGRSVVPVAEVRRPHPDLTRADLDVHAREGRQVIGVRAPRDERQLGGAVVVVHPRSVAHGRVVPVPVEPVAGDDDAEPVVGGEVVEAGRREHGMARVAGGVDQRRAQHRGVHGCEEVHGGRERAGHPHPRRAVQTGQPLHGGERRQPRLGAPDHGAWTCRRAGGGQRDRLAGVVGGEERRDGVVRRRDGTPLLRQLSPSPCGGSRRAVPGRRRARHAR